MKNLNTNFLQKLFVLCIVSMVASSGIHAQEVVTVEPGSNLSDIILGDSLANGTYEPKIYELNGFGLYEVTKTLDVGTKLHIRGKVAEGENLPQVRTALAGEGYPNLINNAGDITLENIYISNKEGSDFRQPNWGGIRINAENSKFVVENCVIEWDKAAAIMIRKPGCSVFINNSIVSKTGDWKAFNGNGRLIDCREFAVDSIVVTNTTMYQLTDRIIRSMGGDHEINYFKFDHNTAFNIQGFHGVFQLGYIHEAVITNNLFQDVLWMGNHPNTAEQNTPAPDNEDLYFVTVDTVPEDLKLTISHNIVGFSDKITTMWAGLDSVSQPEFLSPTVAEFLGDDASEAYTMELVEFANVPSLPEDYVDSLYLGVAIGLEVFPDNFATDVNFNAVDASYNTNSIAFAGDMNDEPVGSHQWIDNFTVGIEDLALRNKLGFGVYPNPMKNLATITFELKKQSMVNIYLIDITGKKVRNIMNEQKAAGKHNIEVSSANINPGVYFLSLSNDNQRYVQKLIIK